MDENIFYSTLNEPFALETEIEEIKQKISQIEEKLLIAEKEVDIIRRDKLESRLLVLESRLQQKENTLLLQQQQAEPLRRLIVVKTFTKFVSDCTCFLKLTRNHNFVDLDRVVDECAAHIYTQLPRETTVDEFRVPPLALTRFARGGKTVTLAEIFDKLKSDGRVNPILISFNGHGLTSFKPRAGETQTQSILRLIAVQLVDYTSEQAQNLIVDRNALDLHLGDGVVLLLDELNNVGPLDNEAAALLREMFLDRAGRFLVFTSHFPVSVEGEVSMASDFLGNQHKNARPRFRGVLTVNMSIASTLSELRSMSTACEALTEEGAAWLGYIPSLVYCTQTFSEMSPSDRFQHMSIPVEHDKKQEILHRFLEELLGGQRDQVVGQYYGAFASIGANSRVSYPLCYVTEIFTQLRIEKAVSVILDILGKLKYHLTSKQSGLAWECTVEVAIILRMLEAKWFGSPGPFHLVPDGTNPELAFRTLPDECHTLTDAKNRMDRIIAEYKTPTLIYVTSAYAKFPQVEGFVIYTSGLEGSEAKIVGFQMKSADRKPCKSMNETLVNGGAVLIRGNSLAKKPRAPKIGWTYMTSTQIRGLLGNSLLLAMPREWLQDP